jgi:hypothetical protein
MGVWVTQKHLDLGVQEGNVMGRHPFNFAGGNELSTMGATWFVSYAYYFY